MLIKLAAVAVLGFALTGCGKAVPPGAGAPEAAPPGAAGPKATPVFVDTSCPKTAFGDTPPPGGPIPDDFVTSWVLRCRTDLRDKPGQGKWQVQVAERADTPATELVEALRQPSDPRTAEACTLELVVPPYFVLVDAAGKAVQPAVPTDACGKPRRETLALLDKLTFRTLSETRLNQVQTPKSVETGCSDDWKDEIAIELGSAKPGPAKPLPPSTGPLQVCGYDRISDDQTPVGKLTTGHSLSSDEAAAVRAALGKAGPAAACTAKHTRFAVLLLGSGTGRWAAVELDGCRRMLRDGTLSQVDEATVKLLSR